MTTISHKRPIRRRKRHVARAQLIAAEVQRDRERAAREAVRQAVTALQAAGGVCSQCGRQAKALVAVENGDGTFSAFCTEDFCQSNDGESQQ